LRSSSAQATAESDTASASNITNLNGDFRLWLRNILVAPSFIRDDSPVSEDTLVGRICRN
jgi:hypothetical protein